MITSIDHPAIRRLSGVGVMTQDEFERSTYVELLQFAAAMDRMSGQCADRRSINQIVGHPRTAR